MGSLCGCFGQPASKHPRKTYNTLVPDVFPNEVPSLEEPISISTQRRISKLDEYCQGNPPKISKVSRRLSRRILAALKDRQYGYVKVAVSAYAFLLGKSANADSNYSFNYFTQELVHQHDPIIHKLMTYPKLQIQALGADLLAAYTTPQNEVEHRLDVVESFIVTVCTMATESDPGCANTDASNIVELQVACLRAIREYLSLCTRLKLLPRRLEEVEACLLHQFDHQAKGYDWLLQPAGTAQDSVSASDITIITDGKPSVDSAAAAALVAKSIRHPAAGLPPGNGCTTPVPTVGVDGSSAVAELAKAGLLQFAPFLQELATVYRVMEGLFQYLDAQGRWQRRDLVEGLVHLIKQSIPKQSFPLFTALLRHSSTSSLTIRDRGTIIKLAASQDIVYSLSAFTLALQELPKAILAATTPKAGGMTPAPQADLEELRQVAVAAVARLALEVGDAAQLCDAVGSGLRAFTGPSLAAAECLQLAWVAVGQIPKFEPQGQSFPAKVFPSGLVYQLCTILTSWSDTVSSTTALSILNGVIAAAGGVLPRDERSAAPLLNLVYNLVGRPNNSPEDFAILDGIVRAVAAPGARRPVLLLATKLAVTLRTEAAGGRAMVPGAQRAAATLLLVNSLLRGVAAATACPALAATTLKASEPSLKIMENGRAVAAGAAFEAAGEAAAVAQLEALALQEPPAVWTERVISAVSQEGHLTTEYGPTVIAAQLREPFVVSGGTVGALAGAAPCPAGSSTPPADCTVAGGPLRPLEGQTPAELSSKLAQLSRARMASVRQERINLRNVLDILGDTSDSLDAGDASSSPPAGLVERGVGGAHASSTDGMGPAATTAQARLSSVAPLAPPTSRAVKAAGDTGGGGSKAVATPMQVQDVLDLMQHLPARGTLPAKGETAAVAHALEPTVGAA